MRPKECIFNGPGPLYTPLAEGLPIQVDIKMEAANLTYLDAHTIGKRDSFLAEYMASFKIIPTASSI